jgi:hypothetical protein
MWNRNHMTAIDYALWLAIGSVPLLFKTSTKNSSFSKNTFHYVQLHLKSKAVPVHAMEAYGGSKGMVPLILAVGITWELSDQLHPAAAVSPSSSGPQTV